MSPFCVSFRLDKFGVVTCMIVLYSFAFRLVLILGSCSVIIFRVLYCFCFIYDKWAVFT